MVKSPLITRSQRPPMKLSDMISNLENTGFYMVNFFAKQNAERVTSLKRVIDNFMTAMDCRKEYFDPIHRLFCDIAYLNFPPYRFPLRMYNLLEEEREKHIYLWAHNYQEFIDVADKVKDTVDIDRRLATCRFFFLYLYKNKIPCPYMNDPSIICKRFIDLGYQAQSQNDDWLIGFKQDYPEYFHDREVTLREIQKLECLNEPKLEQIRGQPTTGILSAADSMSVVRTLKDIPPAPDQVKLILDDVIDKIENPPTVQSHDVPIVDKKSEVDKIGDSAIVPTQDKQVEINKASDIESVRFKQIRDLLMAPNADENNILEEIPNLEIITDTLLDNSMNVDESTTSAPGLFDTDFGTTPIQPKQQDIPPPASLTTLTKHPLLHLFDENVNIINSLLKEDEHEGYTIVSELPVGISPVDVMKLVKDVDKVSSRIKRSLAVTGDAIGDQTLPVLPLSFMFEMPSFGLCLLRQDNEHENFAKIESTTIMKGSFLEILSNLFSCNEEQLRNALCQHYRDALTTQDLFYSKQRPNPFKDVFYLSSQMNSEFKSFQANFDLISDKKLSGEEWIRIYIDWKQRPVNSLEIEDFLVLTKMLGFNCIIHLNFNDLYEFQWNRGVTKFLVFQQLSDDEEFMLIHFHSV